MHPEVVWANGMEGGHVHLLIRKHPGQNDSH
jgi:hypothetical protein